MINKARSLMGLIFLLLALLITACQAEQPNEDVCPLDATLGEYDADCLPIGSEAAFEDAAYPVEEDDLLIWDEQMAYPITEADLAMLIQRWRLTVYAEDGIESTPPVRILTFATDGTYTMNTESEIIAGTWTSILQAMESSLVFDAGTGYDQYYQIIGLGQAELNLRTWRDGMQIDERYLPDL